jgi:PIN domain nuclease of toxin-antitoxin system
MQRAMRSRNPANDILFGTASTWEVAIKAPLGRPDLAVRAETIAREALARGFAELLIRWQTASIVADLPMQHRDPFDRILLAQAITEPVHFYTVDQKFVFYSSLVVLASTAQPATYQWSPTWPPTLLISSPT